MWSRSPVRVLATCLAFVLVLTACGTSSEDSATTSGDTDGTTTTAAPDGGDATASAVDTGLFFEGALAEEVTTEDCTLSGGVETTCYRITVAGDPVSYDTGPFCPDTIIDGAEAGGIWFDGTGVYDIDGEFIVGLAELYEDDNWMMYDEDGNVLVTETAEEFDLAARPDVDPSLQNHCVEGRLEWLENGEPISTTVLIPVEPVLAESPSTTNGNLGVTLDGVVIAQSAPVDAILAAYTIAAFDDCGGHYNPVDGYHLHGAIGCSELDGVSEGETPMFAYAMDGFPIHSPLAYASSADLDACNGHTTEADGYHYHANSAEQNLVVECLVGQTVAGAEAGGGRPPGQN
ncbi:MAG: YHYH protein [Acidimicrobiales bacterium]|nr:YHYH protein [Acidimicrobiales bacterium]